MGTRHYEIRDNEGGFIDSFSVTSYEFPSVDNAIGWISIFIFTFTWWLLKLTVKFFFSLAWISLKHLWGFGIFISIGSIYFKNTDPHMASLMLWGGFAFFCFIAILRIFYAMCSATLEHLRG
ncbi:MAG: hypothetical protein HZC02_05030 [Candidatus Levybacteria bacterium]|nr:hypothetical protein [Candidatus Levybacteria bacterium]